MTIYKKIASENITPLNKEEFVKNTKFTYDHRLWTVTEEIKSDSDNLRRVKADDGSDEIFPLRALQEELANGHIHLSEPTKDQVSEEETENKDEQESS